MIKSPILFTVLFLFTFCKIVNSQIPNSSFENWTILSSGIETPDYWHSNSSQISESIFKSNDGYQGLYAMNVKSTAQGIEGQTDGQAWLTFSDTSISGIAFQIKCDSISGDASGRIVVSGFRDGNLIPYIGFWESQVESEDYSRVEVLFSNQEIYDSIRIFVNAITAINEVGIQLGYASLLVDNLEGISSINSQNEISIIDLKIFPNPANSEISIQYDFKQLKHKNILFEIKNTVGQTLSSSKINPNSKFTKLDCGKLLNGVYLIQFKSDENVIFSETIVIER